MSRINRCVSLIFGPPLMNVSQFRTPLMNCGPKALMSLLILVSINCVFFSFSIACA